jgi:hypothetical protein
MHFTRILDPWNPAFIDDPKGITFSKVLSIGEFPRQLLERAQIQRGNVHDIISCLGSESAEIAERTGLPKLALSILVNDRKNSQRKGSVTGEKQEFINLRTVLSPLFTFVRIRHL